MKISDETGTPKTLRLVSKSEEAAEKALQEKKVDAELGKKLGMKRKEENWAGIVVYAVDTQWEGKFEELKSHSEKENNITLTKTPHWLSKGRAKQYEESNWQTDIPTTPKISKSTTQENISPEERRRNYNTQHAASLGIVVQCAE
ncbi:uncharacterized protein LAJ45_11114 [Morchella importuna]|uniref:uncharacterized protein n=1 Tax=Morchella importuna TaxID=1174673 RepID=UPI001E8E2519|nr:uncharacterized protein LAJ45_11114 [Morchella importuna]KAH8144908.1 hypothetical protein LAJ45_11114 [Morchella importuna]